MTADMAQDIKKILYDYIKIESYTDSPGEKLAENFLLNYFQSIPYFQENPHLWGAYPIEQDPFDRAVCYALLKGPCPSPDTIVLLHHYDVVAIDDFKHLKHLAFSPDALYEELVKIKQSFSLEIQSDIDSGAYMFGHGACDMKAGAAIQLALLKHYSSQADFKGNILVLGLPDEENLSAGMRSAVLLLKALQEQHGLHYKLAVNSEPHQRKEPEKGMFSIGSVGKLMPFIYVRGVLSHAGKVFEGLNPLNIMSEIVRLSELNMELGDVLPEQATPPPTWLYLRDDKKQYDVSMPLSSFGYFSILTLEKTLQEALTQIEALCKQAASNVLADMNMKYSAFLQANHLPQKQLPWQVQVMDFNALHALAASQTPGFEDSYAQYMEKLHGELNAHTKGFADCQMALLEFVLNVVEDTSPKVIYGLIPPFYPSVCNVTLQGLTEAAAQLPQNLCAYAQEAFDQCYDIEHYYTGISDLSYTAMKNSQAVVAALRNAMPFYEKMYHIPVETIEQMSMPCINIGPWGKDFHKLTERVYKEDVFVRTPLLVNHAVSLLLAKD